MTNQEAKEWIINHYGLEDDGTKQSQAISRAINALAALEEIKDEIAKLYTVDVGVVDKSMVLKIIDESINKGHWIDRGSLSCRCDKCGCKSTKESRYCPNCGAKMVKPQESEV